MVGYYGFVATWGNGFHQIWNSLAILVLVVTGVTVLSVPNERFKRGWRTKVYWLTVSAFVGFTGGLVLPVGSLLLPVAIRRRRSTNISRDEIPTPSAEDLYEVSGPAMSGLPQSSRGGDAIRNMRADWVWWASAVTVLGQVVWMLLPPAHRMLFPTGSGFSWEPRGSFYLGGGSGFWGAAAAADGAAVVVGPFAYVVILGLRGIVRHLKRPMPRRNPTTT